VGDEMTEKWHYTWPQVTAVSLDAGAIQLDVHAIRSSDNGGMTFMVFRNGSVKPARQVELLTRIAEGMGDEIVQLHDTDITEQMGRKLAEVFASSKEDVMVVPGTDLLNDRPLKVVKEDEG
jgi:hypothetical protein